MSSTTQIHRSKKYTACLITFIVGLVFACVAFAEIYKWVDENGRVHFSDVAPEDQPYKDIEKEIKSKLNIFQNYIKDDQDRLQSTYINNLLSGVPDQTDLYLLTFAGDGRQKVFMRESLYVQSLFEEKYATKGRSLALINHASATSKYLVASDENLQMVLNTFGELMDEEDVLYLYLTSHGSKDHKLEVNFPPHAVRDFGPHEINRMLDQANIKWRVIVVSACYSGGFIEPLKNQYTMIATASDAIHTSFGCSDSRDFTYYGEAIFKRLMSNGTGLVDALDKAREVVHQMEIAQNIAHHSNPQFWNNELIKNKMGQFETEIMHRQ